MVASTWHGFRFVYTLEFCRTTLSGFPLSVIILPETVRVKHNTGDYNDFNVITSLNFAILVLILERSSQNTYGTGRVHGISDGRPSRRPSGDVRSHGINDRWEIRKNGQTRPWNGGDCDWQESGGWFREFMPVPFVIFHITFSPPLLAAVVWFSNRFASSIVRAA